jgi:hypothetical protein
MHIASNPSYAISSTVKQPVPTLPNWIDEILVVKADLLHTPHTRGGMSQKKKVLQQGVPVFSKFNKYSKKKC